MHVSDKAPRFHQGLKVCVYLILVAALGLLVLSLPKLLTTYCSSCFKLLYTIVLLSQDRMQLACLLYLARACLQHAVLVPMTATNSLQQATNALMLSLMLLPFFDQLRSL